MTNIGPHPNGARPLFENLEPRLLLDALSDSAITEAQKLVLLDGLQGLAGWAQSVDGFGTQSQPLPIVEQSIGEALNLADIIQTGLYQPVSDYFTGDVTPTTTELVTVLQGLSASAGGLTVTVNPASVTGGLLASGGSNELQFNLVLQAERTTATPIDLGADSQAHNLVPDPATTVQLVTGLDFDFTFGFDLYPGLPDDQAFFIRVAEMSLTADVHHSADLNFDMLAGFMDTQVQNGTANLDAQVDISLVDPDTSGEVTLGELQGTGLASLLATSTTSSVNASLPVHAELGAFAADATITVTDADLFADPATAYGFVDFGELDNFGLIRTTDMTAMLDQLATQLGRIGDSSVFGAAIPMIHNRTVGSLLDLDQAFRAKVNTPVGSAWGSAQEFATALAGALGVAPSVVDAAYDPFTDELTYNLVFTHSFAPIAGAWDFTAVDLGPLTSLTSASSVNLTGQATAELTFGFDLSAVGAGETLADHFFIQDGSIDGGVTIGAASFNGSARYGFLAINVGTGDAAGSGQVSTELTDTIGTPGGRLSLPELTGAAIADATTITTSPIVTGTEDLNLHNISVVSNMLGGLPSNPSISIHLPDFQGLAPAALSYSNFAPIQNFEDVTFSDIVNTLVGARNYLSDLAGTTVLSGNVPMINQSVSDLTGYVSRMDALIAGLQADPQDTLQTVAAKIRQVLGLPAGSGLVGVSVSGDDILMDVTVATSVSDSRAYNLDIATLAALVTGGVPSELVGVSNLADVSGTANLAVTGGSTVALNLGVNLADPMNPAGFMRDSTHMDLTARAAGTNLTFVAAVGPLSLNVTNGSAATDADGAAGTGAAATFGTTLAADAVDHRYLMSELNTGLATTSVTGMAGAMLPIYFPDPGTPLGGPAPANNLVVNVTNLGDMLNGVVGSVTMTSPDIHAQFALVNLLDSLGVITPGMDQLFGNLQPALDANVFGITLPMVGNQLPQVSQFLEQIRPSVVAELDSRLGGAAPIPPAQGATEIFDPPPQVALVQLALFAALGPGGANLLVDGTDTPLVSADQIPYTLGADYVEFTLNLHQDIINGVEPLNFTTAMGGLGLDIAADVDVQLSWDFDFTFGVSLSSGFYFRTDNDAMAVHFDSEIQPGSTLDGTFNFLVAHADDGVGAPAVPTTMTADFAVDFQDIGGADNKLTFAELAGVGGNYQQLIGSATVTGALDLNMHLTAGSGDTNDGMPTLAFDLLADWTYTSVDALTATIQTFGDRPVIEIRDVQIDIGATMDKFVRPVLDTVADTLRPYKPILDVLTARLPVFSDIGVMVDAFDRNHDGKVTLMDLATFLGTAFVDFAEAALNIYDLASNPPLSPAGDPILINLGSFGLGDFDARQLANSANVVPQVLVAADAFLTQLGGITEPFAGELKTFLETLLGLPGDFRFQLLEDPHAVFDLLLGHQNTLLFSYDMPELTLNFELSQTFPLIGPLGVEVVGTLDAKAHLAFGFDTWGLEQFFTSSDPADILNGLYVSDRENVDGTGADVDEATITASIQALGVLDLFIVSGGVGGGLFADVTIDLVDPNNDGRIRYDEIQDLGITCLFDVDGELSLALTAKITVGIWPLEKTWRFRIASVKLLDFGWSCGEGIPPILATDMGGGVLRLNMGPNAGSRVNSFTDDVAESFAVFHVAGVAGAEMVRVEAFGFDQTYGGVSHITGNGGLDDDRIVIMPEVLATAELWGGVGADELAAGGGNTTLHGGDGNDTLAGGLGDDFIYGDANDDGMSGGAGTDTLDGGDGADDMDGGDDNDTLYGGAGMDGMTGGLGDDTLFGGDDHDDMSGAEGVDALHGEGGSDSLSGNAGIDTLWGGAGDDTMHGDEGNDVLHGEAGLDYLYGDDDDDELYGGDEADHVFGGLGKDHAYGQDGDDYIQGDEDDDVIEGGGGSDTLFGGFGNDWVVGGSSAATGADGVDTIHGGDGDDIILGDDGLIISDSPVTVTLYAGGAGDSISGGGGEDYIYGQDGPDNIEGGTSQDVIYGGAGQDTIRGNDNNDTIHGEADHDTIYGDAGQDAIEGGGDADTIYGGSANDAIFGHSASGAGDDAATDTIYGDGGVDTVHGDAGNDDIHGGSGNDVLNGDAGADTIHGDNNDDLIWGHNTIGGDDLAADVLYGDAGVDTIHGQGGNDWVFGGTQNDLLYGEGGADQMTGGADNDTMYGGTGIDTMAGDGVTAAPDNLTRAGDGRDLMYGEDGADVMYGNANRDEMHGGTGMDHMFGGDDGDVLYGEVGQDELAGNAGSDLLLGGADNDTISGDGVLVADASESPTDGGDRIEGGTGDDTVYGNGGADRILGQDGSDTLSGGSGRDYIDGGQGTDDIAGDDDDDVLSAGGGTGNTLDGGAGQDVVTGSDTGDDTLNGGSGADQLYGLGGDDELFGDDGNDLLDGGAGADALAGNTGKDELHGGLGADTLYGHNDNFVADEDAADVLFGDAGTDTLYGQGGADELHGGDDNDTLHGGEGRDAIHGDTGADTLHGEAGDDLLYAGSGPGDELFGGTGNDTLTGGDDVDILHGEAGEDLLLGGGAADQLYGGDDDDRILGQGGDDHINGDAGADVLIGGDDSDTIRGHGTAGPDDNAVDTLIGDNGEDDISAGAAGDTLYGNGGNDFIYGEGGGDMIAGDNDLADVSGSGDGDDRIYAGAGNDTVYGNGGDDFARGGPGSDTGYGGLGVNDFQEFEAGLFMAPDPGAGPDSSGAGNLEGKTDATSLSGTLAMMAAVEDLAPVSLPVGPAAAGRWGELAWSASGVGLSGNPGLSIEPAATFGSGDAPIVAWADARNGNFEIYVARWNGTIWEELNGSAGGGGISGSAGSSRNPAIAADASGNPIVAWSEDVGGNTEIYVRRWDGANWVAYGASASGGGISVSAGSSVTPALAVRGDGTPVVAWADDSSGPWQIYARAWSGAAWAELAGSGSGSGVSSTAPASRAPTLSANGSLVALGWEEGDEPSREIYVRQWNPTPGAWQELSGSASGGGLSGNSTDSQQAAVAYDASGNMVAAWSDGVTGAVTIRVARHSSGAWGDMGTGSRTTGVSQTSLARSPRLAVSAGGAVALGWLDDRLASLIGDSVDVYVRQWSGSQWVEQLPGDANFGGISRTAGDAVGLALAIDSTGHAMAAWADTTSVSHPIAGEQPGGPEIYVRYNTLDISNVYYVNVAADADLSDNAYTAASGSDAGGTGLTPASPKATLAGLFSALHPGFGDVVLIDTGSYTGQTVLADSGSLIVGSPNAAVLTWHGGGPALEISNADDIVIQGLSFDGEGLSIIDGAGSSDRITVLESIFDATGQAYAASVTDGTGLVLAHNDLTGGTVTIHLSGTAGALLHDNTLSDGGTGILIDPASVTTGLLAENNRLGGMTTGIRFNDAGGDGQILSNEVTGSTTGLHIAAAMGGGVVRGNDVSGGVTALLYEASAMVEGNAFHGATTGAVVVGDLGANGETVPNEFYDNATGVQLTGTIQLNNMHDNTTGVTGSGTVGALSHDRDNEIYDNGTGVGLFDGSVRFSKIYGNTTGIDAVAGLMIQENILWGNTGQGIRIAGVSDVQIRNNTIDAAVGDAIRLTAGASNVMIVGNILWARTGYDINVDNDSQAGFWSDYNDLHASESGKLVWWTRPFDDLLDWQEDVWAYDFHSIGRTDPNPTWSDPRFIDPARGDFRVQDPVGGLIRTSPTIGMGDPQMDFRLRPWAYPNRLTNAGFESGLTGWQTNPEAAIQSASPSPFEGGNYFFAGTVAEGFAQQTIDLLASGLTAQQIDTGIAYVNFGGWVQSAGETTRDQGQIQATFLDAGDVEVGTMAEVSASNLTSWEDIVGEALVPAGARKVQFRYVATRKTGPDDNAYLDGAFLYTFAEVALPNQGAFGNVPGAVTVPATTIQLTFPYLYTDWENFKPRQITWHTSGNTSASSVRIELWQDTVGGPSYLLTIAASTPDDGSYTWIPLDDSGILPGTFGLRIEVRLVDKPWVSDLSVEPFAAPEDTTTFYVDDASNVGDDPNFTPLAVGNNRNTGRVATAPKPNPLNILRIYQIDAGDTLYIDTGQYPLLRTVVLSGQADIGDDEGLAITGPIVGGGTAEFVTAIPANAAQDLVEFYDADFVTIERLTLTGGRHAMYIHDHSLSMIGTNLVAANNAGSGLYFTGGSHADLLDNITTFGHTGGGHYGLYVQGGIGGTISNVVAHDNYDGVYIVDPADVTLNNIESYSNTRYGIYAKGPQLGGTNLTAHHSDVGMYLWDTGGAYGLVSNPVSHDNSAGIQLVGLTNIQGGTAYANTGYGVNLDYYSFQTVDGTEIYANGNGVYLRYGEVDNARIYGNTGRGIYADYNTAYVRNSVIYGNQLGGLFANPYGTMAITNNLVYGNEAGGLHFTGAQRSGAGADLVNNTIHEETGDAISISANSRNFHLRNNILASSGYGIYVATDSQTGFTSDYNLFYPLAGGDVGYWQGTRTTLSDWKFATFLDGDSLSADPLFVDPAGPDGQLGYDRIGDVNHGDDDDFHLSSTSGSYHDGAWTPDLANSPGIDRADAADSYANEPAPDGGYRNLGAYGNTAQASRSPAQYVLVMAANGAERWAQTTDQTVKWRSNGFAGNVDIRYSADAGMTWADLALNQTNTGQWLWQNISTIVSDQYLLEIRSHDTIAIADLSDGEFTVTEPIFFYYVDDGSDVNDEYTPGAIGNDGNSGLDPMNPKASIRAILDTYDLNDGDIIFVDTGVYNVTANILVEYADSGVTIIGPSASDHQAMLDRGATGAGNYVFELSDAHYITLKYLTITGAHTGVYVGNGSANLTLDANTAFNNAVNGLHITDSASSDAQLLNNTFYGTTGNSNTDQEYDVRAYGADPIVHANVAYHTPGSNSYGLWFYDIGTGVFTDNVVYNNSNIGLYARGAQITVSGNVAYGNGTGIQVYDTHSGMYGEVFGNESYGNATGIYSGGYENVHDNIARDNTSTGIYGGYTNWCTIQNNDVYRNVNGITLQTGVASDNRVWGNSNVGLYATYGGSTFERNVSYSNAYGIYVDSDYGNVTLRNNLVYDNTTRGIEFNNVTGSYTRDVVNNTVYELSVDAVVVTGGSINVHLRNNILRSGSAYELYVADNSQVGFASDYNLFASGGSANFLYWQQDWDSLVDWFLELGFDGNSRIADPAFVDIDGADDILGAWDPGLTGSYYDNENLAGSPVLTRLDSNINFAFGYGSPAPGVPTDHFSVRWEGYIYVPADGDWTFYTTTDDGERFTFDGSLIIDQWAYHSGAEQSYTATGLTAGWYPISHEMHDATSNSYAYLRWQGPGVAKQIVSRWNLSTTLYGGDFGGDDDFHLMSTHGSYHGGAWVSDVADSPGIDAGSLADAFANETVPNGDRINLGAYGNTAEASRSPAAYIQVLSPNGSEKFRVGQATIVRWRAGGVGALVDVYLSTDAGGSWGLVAGNELNDGNFAWNPASATDEALLRVVDAGDPAIADDSDNVFVVGPAGHDYYINILGDTDFSDNEYTSAAGDNTNSGTDEAHPMASLRALLSAYDLEPGDTIWIDTGMYDLVASAEIGSADAGITIRGPVDTGHSATIDRGNPGSPGLILADADDMDIRDLALTGGSIGMYVRTGSSNLSVQGVTIYNNRDTGLYVEDAASDHVTITGSEFFGTTGDGNTDQNRGIDIRGQHPTVTGNSFYHTPGAIGDGAYIQDTVTATVTDNEARNNSGTGIWIRAGQITASGNVVHDNGTGLYVDDNNSAVYGEVFGNESYGNATGIYSAGYDNIHDNVARDNTSTGIYGDYTNWRTIQNNDVYRNVNGITLQTGVASDNRVWGNSNVGLYATYGGSTFERNVSYSNAYGIYVDSDYGNVTLRNNLVYDNTTRGIEFNNVTGSYTRDVVNNTVYELSVDAVVVTGGSINVHLRNNILRSGSAYELYVADNSQVGFASDYNLFASGGSANFLYWQRDFDSLVDWFLELGFDGNSRVADPAFVDIDGADDILGAWDPGLTGSYYDNENLAGSPVLTRLDSNINFAFGYGSPTPGVPTDHFSVRWEGYIYVPADGDWTFYTTTDDGERFTFDGSLIIDQWAPHGGAEQSYTATGLTAGWYPISHEMHDGTSNSYAYLRWQGPGVAKQIVSRWNLSTTQYGGDFGVDDDFHLMSTHGSYHGGAWVSDVADSPGIDAGSLADAFANETVPNGDRINLGAYGNTAEASRSPAAYIQVLSPNGSEKFRVGQATIVRWRSGGVGPLVDVSFSPDDGATWSLVAAGQANDGDFSWSPTTVTDLGLIRITDSATPSVWDDTDIVFVVGPAGHDYYVNIPGDTDFSDNEYTSAAGDNTSSGTDGAHPMASLRALINAYDLDPGDTVWIDTGMYDLVAPVEIGAADAGITIRGPVVGLHEATLDRINYGSYAMTLSNADGVTVADIGLTGGYYGMYVTSGTSWLTADGVTAYNNKQAGVYIGDAASEYATISNGVFYGTPGDDNTDQNRGLDLRGRHPTVTGNALYHTPGQYGDGAYIQDTVTATVTDNEAWNNSSTGIWIRANQITASGNVVHDNGTGLYVNDNNSAVYGQVFGNEAYANATGISSGAYDEIYDNDVHHNTTQGIWTNYSGWRIIRDNEIHHNAIGALVQAGLVSHNRIYINSDKGVSLTYNNVTVDSNAIYGNSTGIYSNQYNGKAAIRNNLVYDNENFGVYLDSTGPSNAGADVVNNTIHQKVGTALYAGNSHTTQVYNNIIWIEGGYGIDVPASWTGFYVGDYNDIHRGVVPTGKVGRWAGVEQAALADWQGASAADSHSLSVDPQFFDIDGADNLYGWEGLSSVDGGMDDNFHLKGGSPVIDAGYSDIAPDSDRDGQLRRNDLGTPNTGAGIFRYYDLGCYEFQGSSNDTVPPTVLTVSSLPPDGGTTGTYFTTITVTFSEPMDYTAATSPANYELLAAGGDGGFGDGGESEVTLDIAHTYGSQNVTLSWGGGPLDDDMYRLTLFGQATVFLADLAGNKLDGDDNGTPGGDHVRTFLLDSAPPTVTNFAMNALGEVPPATVILSVAFSENVTAAAAGLSLYNDTDSVSVPTAGAVFIHTPPAAQAKWDLSAVGLEYGKHYTATIDAGTVVDTSGQPLDGDGNGTPGGDFIGGFLVAIPGDANLDGTVNAVDYIALKRGFGTGTTWSQGNFDGNGVVSRDDLLILMAHMGVTAVLPAAPAGGQAEPSPASQSDVLVEAVPQVSATTAGTGAYAEEPELLTVADRAADAMTAAAFAATLDEPDLAALAGERLGGLATAAPLMPALDGRAAMVSVIGGTRAYEVTALTAGAAVLTPMADPGAQAPALTGMLAGTGLGTSAGLAVSLDQDLLDILGAARPLPRRG